ncbi:MAG: hypothetical protein D4R67_03650 [Bacteroidetes bacterium]|nr:MAG: hypothetical protein D4R67_03650 [Bacteroidota bacterium]
MLPGYSFRTLLLAVIAVILVSCSPETKPKEQSQAGTYQYAETRNLVRFVEEAASVLSREGTAAFEKFREPGSEWCTTSGQREMKFHPSGKARIS